MIRIAAVGDVHYDRSSQGRLAKFMASLEEQADILLIAGDLTQIGTPEEIEPLCEDLMKSTVPVVTIFGNHDLQSDRQDELTQILTEAGVTVLNGATATFRFGSCSLGIVGTRGFGGGFMGACASDFGEPEMKAFVRFTKMQAEKIRTGLLSLQTDYKVALTHYSPCEETLLGEKKEIYPFLGSYLLAEAIDQGGADIAFHGHAHHGVERGITPGGIPVRNVAMPVIRHAFNVYCLNKNGLEQRPNPKVANAPAPAHA